MASFRNALGASRPLVRQSLSYLKNPSQSTCGSDGKIIIWDVSGAEPKLEKTIDGIIPAVVDTQ